MVYSQPGSLSDALTLLEDAGTRIVAGGTDFYPAMAPGQHPSHILDVSRVGGLADITHSENAIRFGAAVTWSDVVKADLPPSYVALKQAAREVGSLQIQNPGTVAGNICNASPAADGVPPLLVLNASVELASAARGTRTLPLGDFIIGVRRTTLAPDEMVTGILMPKTPEAMTSGFEKLGSRRYMVISIAMTAAGVLLDQAGRIAEARIAIGACSAVAIRLTALERDLVGQDPNDITISPDHLAPLAPIDDVRGTSAFRVEAAQEQIRRAIAKAVAA